MWDYPEYEQAKREGKSEEEARFRVADPRVKKVALIALLTGAVKRAITHGIGKVTENREETFEKRTRTVFKEIGRFGFQQGKRQPA